MDEILRHDENAIRVLGGITDDTNQYIRMLRVDPATNRLLVSGTGGGGGGVWYSNEVLTRTNGINYTLANTPLSVLFLYLNGRMLIGGAGNEYTQTGTAIVMSSATLSSDILMATYS